MGLALIKRPLGIVLCEVEIRFNRRQFFCLEIDLNHINLGKGGTRNSNYTVAEVAGIVLEMINDIEFESHSSKQYKNGFCEYFSFTEKYQMKNYKVVFCICTDRPRSIGIITLFRQRGKK